MAGRRFRLLGLERQTSRLNQRSRLPFAITSRGAVAPDRAWPSRVAGRPGDDMQVELADDVAERAEVDLVRAGMSLEKTSRRRRLFDQLCPVGRVEIDQFDDSVCVEGPG